MTHALAVVGHQDRIGRVWELADQVDADFIALDTGRIGPGKNHLRAWRWLYQYGDADWSVVLEDDAIPVKSLDEQLPAALAVAPQPVVSLYLGTGRPQHWQDSLKVATERPECWIVTPALLHHVGVAIKTSLVPLMLDYVVWRVSEGLPVDEAISLWMRQKQKVSCAYTHPSLVDHEDDLPTTITARHSMYAGENSIRDVPRKAWLHGGRETWDDSTYTLRRPAMDYRVVIPS